MPRWFLLLCLLSVCCLTSCQPEGAAQTPFTYSSPPPVEVFFSPKGGCTDAIVTEIGFAQRSILVQAYSFTSAPIAQALVQAHQRGVQVYVIVDKSQLTESYSEAGPVAQAGVPVLVDEHHAIAHNKIMVLDGQTVITGSFNFTKQAEEHNAENMLVIRDAALAERYTANWRVHAEHSEQPGNQGTATVASRPAKKPARSRTGVAR